MPIKDDFVSDVCHVAYDHGMRSTAELERTFGRLCQFVISVRHALNNSSVDEARCALEDVEAWTAGFDFQMAMPDTNANDFALRRIANMLWDGMLGEVTAAVSADKEKIVQKNAELELRLSRVRRHSINDPQTRAIVYASEDGKCHYCQVDTIMHASLTPDHNPDHMFCVDHMVAKSNGGPDHLSNFLPACSKCNSLKGDRSYQDFKRDRYPRPKLAAGG